MNSVVIHNKPFSQILDAASISKRVELLGKELQEKYRGKNPLFIGILNGAFIFMADLVRACNIDCAVTFVKFSSYRGMTSKGSTDTQIGLQENIAGRPVIIVEDIIDSGQTIHQFLPLLKAGGAASVEIATFLLKPTALRHDFDIHYIGFRISSHFVVGYGLDYDGHGRNLKGVYQLTE